MKRIFATLLALTLVLSLTACGSKSDSGSSAPAETPPRLLLSPLALGCLTVL